MEDSESEKALDLLKALKRAIPTLERLVEDRSIGTRAGIRTALLAYRNDDDDQISSDINSRKSAGTSSH